MIARLVLFTVLLAVIGYGFFLLPNPLKQRVRAQARIMTAFVVGALLILLLLSFLLETAHAY